MFMGNLVNQKMILQRDQKEVRKRLNFKVEYVNYSLSELLKELKDGEIDLVVGINKTPEREK